MSRTIRRKNVKNPYPREEVYNKYLRRCFVFGYEEHFWHSDSYDSNPWSRDVKWHTNLSRRNDERNIVRKAFLDPESDDIYDKEKKYLGIIWIYN